MTNLNYIRRYYKMPFLKRGLDIRFQGMAGKVVAFSKSHAYVHIKLKHVKRVQVVHPCWQISYFDKDGKLLAEYKD